MTLMSAPMSHNVLSDLTTRPASSAANESVAFSQLRSSLIKVLRNSPESREPICDALELIEALQQQIETKRHPDPAEPPQSSRAKSKGAAVQEYVVHKTHEGEFLTERRPSGSQPFRCPRDAYDAAAKILAEAAGPLHFEELLDRLNAAMGERQADYRLRVCLRFWVGQKVVERFRTRYRVVDGESFVHEARELWETISAQHQAS
jgi:hypothetical protein